MRLGVRWMLALGVVLAAHLAPAAALAADCTLLKVAKGKADLVVYFTKFVEEDKTGGRYKRCKIVKKAREGTQTFRITPFRQDASVVVHRSNWP